MGKLAEAEKILQAANKELAALDTKEYPQDLVISKDVYKASEALKIKEKAFNLLNELLLGDE